MKEELHFRRIDMRGYRRDDGLFEIEGRVTDRKTMDFAPASSDRSVPAGDAVHDMGVRLVFDEDMIVHAVETFSNAFPYPQCIDGGNAFGSLVGLRIGGGWNHAVRSRLGGARGCTHLMELLIPMATAALQSLSHLRQSLPDRVDPQGRPVKIDSCYAYGASRDLVRRRWPAYYEPPAQPESDRPSAGQEPAR